MEHPQRIRASSRILSSCAAMSCIIAVVFFPQHNVTSGSRAWAVTKHRVRRVGILLPEDADGTGPSKWSVLDSEASFPCRHVAHWRTCTSSVTVVGRLYLPLGRKDLSPTGIPQYPPPRYEVSDDRRTTEAYELDVLRPRPLTTDSPVNHRGCTKRAPKTC